MKLLSLKNLTIILLFSTLLSCVEGRSGSPRGSNNESLEKDSSNSLSVETEIKQVYSKQQFYTILTSLRILFPQIIFSNPADITGKMKCPQKIANNTEVTLYQNYLNELKNADSKYKKAIQEVSTKRQSSTTRKDIDIFNQILEQLLEEQEIVKSHSQYCLTVIADYGFTPDESDCTSESSKVNASTNKMNSLLSQSNGLAIINQANGLFSTTPITTFIHYSDLHEKINCEQLAGTDKAKASQYVQTILNALSQSINNATATNNQDLSKSDVCLNEISQKTATLLATLKNTNSSKISSCNVAIAAVKPDLILVGTEAGLSVSTNDGATFTNRGEVEGLRGAYDHGKRHVYSIKNIGSKVILATEAGVAISNNNAATFTNFAVTNFYNGKPAHVQDVEILGESMYVSSWELGVTVMNLHGSLSGHAISKDSLSLNTNEVCFTSADTTMYTATHGGLSISYDMGKSYSQNHTTGEGLLHNEITGVTCTTKTVFVYTSNGISVSYDGAPYVYLTVSSNQLASNNVHKVFLKNDKIYVATDKGLSIATIIDGKHISFTNYTMPNNLNDVRDVFVDDKGTIYAALYKGGLAISSTTNGSITFTRKSTGMNNLNALSVLVMKQ